VDHVHQRRLTGLRTSLNAGHWLPDRWLGWNQSNWYLCSGVQIQSDAGLPSALHSRCKSYPAPIRWLRWQEFEFSQATVVGFRWGLLLRDHSDEGNVFMLTLIGGEWQRSPAMVRRLGQCLSTVRVASGEASAPRTCAKASFSSLLASRSSNCSDRRWKTWIWWLPWVRWVLDLRPKICTICGAIYRGF
jgi:hypothetical protein